MVSIKPFNLMGIHQPSFDKPQIDGRKRQSLEAEHLPFRPRNRSWLDRQQIFDTDPECVGGVIPRLVGKDHAGR